MKAAKKARRKLQFNRRLSAFELLEHRRLLTIYADLAGALGPGSLSQVQNNLNSALNTASKIPLLTQATSGVLGNFQAAQIVTDPVVANVKSALSSGSVIDDATAKSAIASALSLSATDVLISHPGGASNIEVEIHLHRTAAAATLPADFKLNVGLPGLPVNVGASTTGSIDATIGYDYALAFGYNGSLFVDTTKKVSDFATSLSDPNHQLVLGAVLKLSNDFAATATVGLLQAIIDNRSHTSKLDATFSVDSLGLSGTPSIAVAGNANLKLHAAASFAATTDSNSGASFQFPSIGTDLIVNWNLASGNKPDVSYGNVSFELGSFLSSFVRPIIQDIQVFTQPLQPLISVLTAPLPGLSDLSHLIDQGDVTLLGIAKVAAQEGAFGPGIDEAVELVATLVQITKDINSLDTSSGGVMVPLGDFNLDTSGDSNDVTNSLLALGTGNVPVNFDNLGAVGVDLAKNLLKGIQSSNAINGIEDAADKIGLGGVARDQLAQLGKRLDSLETGGVQLNFPIIDDPASVIFPMLLGHDGDLASFDAHLNFNADEKGLPTGLEAFGLGIEASGSVNVQANLHVAYDTFGIREFFRELSAGMSHPEDLLDGFYIADATPDKPLFALGGSITLGVGVSAGFFSVNVGGGVFTSNDGSNPDAVSTNDPTALVANLHDANSGSDDGKLRLSKIGADPDDPGCLFEVGGQLGAGAAVTVKVGVDTFLGFVGYEHTFNIATVTLIDLNGLNCLGKAGAPPAQPPVLAGVNGSVLTLYLGTHANQRQNVPGDDGSDKSAQWIVQPSTDTADPPDTLIVSAFGVQQKFSGAGITEIDAQGDTAGQSISIQMAIDAAKNPVLIAANAVLNGSSSDDQLTYLGSGHATLSGGDGGDRLTVGPDALDSILRGGIGNNILIGGGGNDQLFSDGEDNLFGGAGNDLINWHTGNGSASVDGGTGVNTLVIVGDNQPDNFAASILAGALSVQAGGASIVSDHIQRLDLDGEGGGDTVKLDDLSSVASVQQVHVNQSESTALDSAADAVTVDARAGNNLLIDEAVVNVNGVNGAQVLINGLPYKVYVANPEAQDSLIVNTGLGPNTVTIDPRRVDPSSGSPLPTWLPLPGKLTVNDAPSTNVFNVRSTSGPTTVTVHGGNNVFNVGSLAPATGGTLSGIQAALTLNGSGGADVANIDDAGDTIGQTGALSATTLTGLGMAGPGITYSALSAINIGLGTQADIFKITSTSCPTTVRGGDGADMITLQPTSLVGTVNLDGGNGADSYFVYIIGTGSSLVNIADTGSVADADALTVYGTDLADNFLLRANAGHTAAFVAALHGNPVASVERINYDPHIKTLVLDLQGGDDTATLDDNLAPTTIDGGAGNDHFQVGQIFKSLRDSNAGVAAGDVFATTLTTRGYLSNGVSYATTINGDYDDNAATGGNDEFVVFHNTATLNLNGDAGDDTFTIRAFAKEGSTDTDINGGKNVDLIQYVLNALVNIDGGDGTDTLKIIGTEFADRFVITNSGIFGAGVNVQYKSIEKLIVDGAEGDDEFYVESAGLVVNGIPIDVTLEGGLGNDLFSIAGDTPTVISSVNGRVVAFSGSGTANSTDTISIATADLDAAIGSGTIASRDAVVGSRIEVSSGPGEGRFWQITGVNAGATNTVLTVQSPAIPDPTWGLPNNTSGYAITVSLAATVQPHRVNTVQGALHLDGAGGDGSAGGLGTPVMLPGETNQLNSDGQVLAYTGTGTSLSTDMMTVATAALQVALAREIPTSSKLTDLAGKTLEISDGPGLARFWQITSVAAGPTTTVLTLKSPGMPADEWGLPNTTSSFSVTHLSPNFFVSETDTLDSFVAFNDGSTTGDTGVPLSATALTGLGMDAAGITYVNLETVEVLLGTGNDTFTVTGTAAGAITAVHGGGGGDHLFVTGGGGPTAPLLVYGDTTQDHSRYTSDGTTSSVVDPLHPGASLPGVGFAFASDGDDTIDASMDSQSVAIYGGGGKDVIYGSQVGDHLAGGAGDDEIHGGGGADHIYGDSGFNQTLTTRLDRVVAQNVQILRVVTTEIAGNDKIFGDDGDDIAFGDHGIITQTPGTQRIFTTGNVIGVQTTNVANGGNDEIHGGADNDVLLGGIGDDRIDGDQGQDLVLGDNAVLASRTAGLMTSPRFRALAGTQLYDANGNPLVTSAWQTAPGGLPFWSNWLITLSDGNFGNDYLAGGAGNDTIFGQSGNDTIQGDGSISLTVNATLPSVDDFAGAGMDGDDYVEGGVGSDVILGNLGQDDLIGGSSNLYGLSTAAQRADGADTIFGGSGTAIARNDSGDLSAAGHARDADVILADNGNIYRLVGTNGAAGSAFLTFNYDNYGSAKIIPRVFQPLDYTPGVAAASDIGGSDIVHGERGDDIIHGETGNDVLFGEGQDDQIIGGAGLDRIYGGSGEDSILGDDGRFIISRNGLTEPLYGVTSVNAQINISTPGPFTGAWEYITGRLNTTVRLLVPTLGGNDVIYGGLGDDFIHAGTGDDAVSGAEAQAAWYNSLPVGAAFYSAGGFSVSDPNNPLGYNAATRKLAAYDANNPLTTIPSFLLNFDATDATNNKIDDGKDRIFGDDGNDWLVGGTDNDRMFGGKGDDLINADDNLTTNGGLNNQPDAPVFADRDFVFGGDGLDVMIANTGGDRMFDWGGEFNSYIVPFSPFGQPTIYRSPSPQIQQFLLALGKTSGADQSMTEPNGELGLFTQQDPQWQSNHGGPRDPQAGNIGGTQRDTQGGPEDDRSTALPLAAVLAVVPSGGSSVAANSTDVTLNAAFVSADPSNPSARALFVGGSNAADTILIRQGTNSAYLDVVMNGVDKGQFAVNSNGTAISRIIVYGHDGNDSITVNTNILIDAALYGEAGDDVLIGGGGNTLLDGGIGNDKLTGNGGRNVLVGGLGQDTINGGKNSDILIGGTYKYSADLDAVYGLMAVWKGSGSYSQRVADLRTGGVDAVFAFNNQTVLDDKAVDYLYGYQDQDWYWVYSLDVTDRLKSGVIVN